MKREKKLKIFLCVQLFQPLHVITLLIPHHQALAITILPVAFRFCMRAKGYWATDSNHFPDKLVVFNVWAARTTVCLLGKIYRRLPESERQILQTQLFQSLHTVYTTIEQWFVYFQSFRMRKKLSEADDYYQFIFAINKYKRVKASPVLP